MSKATKIWLAAAAGLILSGIITFAVAIIALEFDFSKLSTEKYVTKTYSPEGTFEEIIVDTNLSDIDFLNPLGVGFVGERGFSGQVDLVALFMESGLKCDAAISMVNSFE